MSRGVVKGYLLLYNLAQFAGWAVALWRMAQHLRATRSFEGSWSAAGDVVGGWARRPAGRPKRRAWGCLHAACMWPLSCCRCCCRVLVPARRSPNLRRTCTCAGWFQLASALEIVHAAAGLVGGSPATALMQWGGRSNVLFGVVAAVPEVQQRAAVGHMFLAWALSEVIRYPWYAASLAGACPHWLTWLRCAAGLLASWERAGRRGWLAEPQQRCRRPSCLLTAAASRRCTRRTAHGLEPHSPARRPPTHPRPRLPFPCAPTPPAHPPTPCHTTHPP